VRTDVKTELCSVSGSVSLKGTPTGWVRISTPIVGSIIEPVLGLSLFYDMLVRRGRRRRNTEDSNGGDTYICLRASCGLIVSKSAVDGAVLGDVLGDVLGCILGEDVVVSFVLNLEIGWSAHMKAQ
jgi:hypothetical protein